MAESNSWNNGLDQGQNRGFSGNGSISGASGTAIRDAIFDRVPPHDDAAEMAVLGGMLMSKDAIGEVSQMIDITDFYQPRNQTVYEAIINLFSASQPVDAVLVANQLLKDGDLEKSGGIRLSAQPRRIRADRSQRNLLCRHHPPACHPAQCDRSRHQNRTARLHRRRIPSRRRRQPWHRPKSTKCRPAK